VREYEFESHQRNINHILNNPEKTSNPEVYHIKSIKLWTWYHEEYNMNKFERLKLELEVSGTGNMKAFGSSMLPILKSGTLLTFEKVNDYGIGDIVFCKVKGRYIDAHKSGKNG
jgi:hypothetical protein